MIFAFLSFVGSVVSFALLPLHSHSLLWLCHPCLLFQTNVACVKCHILFRYFVVLESRRRSEHTSTLRFDSGEYNFMPCNLYGPIQRSQTGINILFSQITYYGSKSFANSRTAFHSMHDEHDQRRYRTISSYIYDVQRYICIPHFSRTYLVVFSRRVSSTRSIHLIIIISFYEFL